MILQDVSELIVDCEHKTAPKQDDGYPSIRTPNIGKGYFLLENVNRVSEETYIKWTKRAVPQTDDIIMAREAPVGNATIIPSGLTPCLGQRTLLIRPDKDKIEPKFLNYLLNGPYIQAIVHAKTNGATVPHLNMKDVRELEMPELPSRYEQKRIAGILSAYDELIENNQRRIRILEEMARSLYREWFVHFRYPGHETVPLVDSPLGPIPKGWEVVALGGICERITDGAHKSPKSVESGVPMASVKDMHDFGFNLSTCRHISEEDYKALVRQDSVVRANDVLIAKDGSYLKHTFVAEKDMKVALLSSIAILRPSEKILSHLLAIGLRDDSVKGRMKQCVSGVAVPRIILKDFRRFQIVLPPEELQYKWNNLAGQSMQMCCSLIAQNRILKAQRDLLLPKLLSGQTRFD